MYDSDSSIDVGEDLDDDRKCSIDIDDSSIGVGERSNIVSESL